MLQFPIVEELVRMLYDFHQSQLSKKAGTVHATYLLDGVVQIPKEPSHNGHKNDDEDVHMQSSPYMSSSMPQEAEEATTIVSRTILLVRQADLEGTRLGANNNSQAATGRKFPWLSIVNSG